MHTLRPIKPSITKLLRKKIWTRLCKLEADRFKNLKFSEEQFKTEAGAVLGEYNKNSASPTFKMYEVMRETAFTNHTYSHTTMGYLKDIKDYPNQYEYAWNFFKRYYRPEYATIVVVGDIKADEVLAKIKQYFGDWKSGDFKQQIPVEPAQKEPRKKHIDWDSQTLAARRRRISRSGVFRNRKRQSRARSAGLQSPSETIPTFTKNLFSKNKRRFGSTRFRQSG